MSITRVALFEGIVLSPPTAPIVSRIPPFLYGCAWKKARTADVVHKALAAGFRGIDVAAQPRHYREGLAGDGMRRALGSGEIKRGDLFIQTKYTSLSGQNPKDLPYDPKASIPDQVKQSVASSLHNLRVSSDPESAKGTYLDSLVLHSPLKTLKETLEAWRTLEAYVPDRIRYLGISNTSLPILQHLYEEARIKPKFVQNRFYRDSSYEAELRGFCMENGIVFQSFWTLTGNPNLVKSAPVRFLADAAKIGAEVALYAFVLALDGNISILNGTTTHMESDLQGLATVKDWVGDSANHHDWETQMEALKGLLRDDTSSLYG